MWWLHNTLRFLLDEMKLGKFEKFVCNLNDKEKDLVYTKTLNMNLLTY